VGGREPVDGRNYTLEASQVNTFRPPLRARMPALPVDRLETGVARPFADKDVRAPRGSSQTLRLEAGVARPFEDFF